MGKHYDFENEFLKVRINGESVWIERKEDNSMVHVFFGRTFNDFTAWLTKTHQAFHHTTLRFARKIKK